MRAPLATIIVLFAMGATVASANSGVLCRTSFEGGAASQLGDCLEVSSWAYERPSCEGTITLANRCETVLVVDGSRLEDGDSIELATPQTVTVESETGDRLANLRAADERYPCTACQAAPNGFLNLLGAAIMALFFGAFSLRAGGRGQ
jgi:hypothetical protein